MGRLTDGAPLSVSRRIAVSRRALYGRPMSATMSSGGLVGIDVGGTFTDAVRADGGRLHVAKVRSTPQDITAGFLDGLDELAAGAGGGGADGGPAYLVHGTTVATNAIVQRRLARTGLITNVGFRDILEI